MEGLKQKERFCSRFVTDSKELTVMVAQPDDCPRFQPELSELAELKKSFSDFELVYQPRDSNVKADLLARNAQDHDTVFSYIGTSVPFWFVDANFVFT